MFAIGQLAQQSGVKIPTIRYYEQIDLLPRPERNTGNHRRYDQTDLKRLSFIKHARSLGFDIASIKQLLELQTDRENPCQTAHDIARTHLADIRRKLDKLGRLENELKRFVGPQHESAIKSCRLMAALEDHALCLDEH